MAVYPTLCLDTSSDDLVPRLIMSRGGYAPYGVPNNNFDEKGGVAARSCMDAAIQPQTVDGDAPGSTLK